MSLRVASSPLSWSERVAILAFALWFPGFLLYHFAINLELIPPFLGGYFGFITVGLLVPLLLFAVARIIQRGLMPYEWLVLLLLSYFVIWSFAHFFLGATHQNSLAQLGNTLTALVLLLALFLAARDFPVSHLVDSRLFTVLFVGMAIVILSQVGDDYLIQLIRHAADANVETSSHQGYARSVVIIALLFLAVSNGLILVLHIVVTTILLFFIGARSEFAGYLIVVCLLLPYWFFANRKIAFGIATGIAVGAYLIMASAMPIDVSRVGELLDLAQSTSFQGRRELTQVATNTILGNPFFGDYGSDRLGYAHNALSAWVSFGLLGFCMYVGLVLCAAAGSFIRLLRSPRTISPIVLASYCFNMYSLTMIIAAKGVSDPVVAIGWGLYAAVLSTDNRKVIATMCGDAPRGVTAT